MELLDAFYLLAATVQPPLEHFLSELRVSLFWKNTQDQWGLLYFYLARLNLSKKLGRYGAIPEKIQTQTGGVEDMEFLGVPTE